MRIEFAVIVLTIVSFAGMSVHAAEEKANPEKKGISKERILEKFDANKNGKLDGDEIEKAKAAHSELAARERNPEGAGEKLSEGVIKKFDKDGDGKLNDQEKKAAFEAMKKRSGDAPAGNRPDIAELIKKFDKNGDGKLDEEERTAAKASRAGAGSARPDLAELIKKFDKNGDGKLDEEERAAAKASRAGAGSSRPELAEIIKKFDKNGDGKLDSEEKSAARKAFPERRPEGKKPEAKKEDK